MTSGVSRHRVRSRFCCRMISCPAAKQIRWVKPSIATVSPSRTSSEIAPTMVVTLLPPALVTLGSRRYLCAHILEQAQSRCGLLGSDYEWRRHADRLVAGAEDEQPAFKARGFDSACDRRARELDSDHQPETAHVLDHGGSAGQV